MSNTMPAQSDAAVNRLLADRRAQGLSPHIENQDVLLQLGALIYRPAATAQSGPAQKSA